MTLRLIAVLCAFVSAGCALRSGRPQTTTASTRLCAAPGRVVVSEFSGDESLRYTATDSWADGLEGFGFRVLAPRRPLPPTEAGKLPRVDWVFSGEIRRKLEGGLDLEVNLKSLVEDRRVWAIIDTRADAGAGPSSDEVRRTVATALEKFEYDLLSCDQRQEP